MESIGGLEADASLAVNGAAVEAAGKLPPPETREEVRTRRWIILSLWMIIALLGIPAWYATTTVPRADLPLDSMNQWAEGRVRFKSVWY